MFARNNSEVCSCPIISSNSNTLRETKPLFVLINPLNAELNPIRHLLALVGAHHILHFSGVRVNVINIFFRFWCPLYLTDSDRNSNSLTTAGKKPQYQFHEDRISRS
jgi:hypothetical protein